MERQLEFYELEFAGEKIPVSQRRRLFRRASSWRDAMTVKCPALREEQEEAIRYAVCAAAEAIYDFEKGQVSKEANGDLSVSYMAKVSATERQSVAQAVFPFLCGTGLLYCGVVPW